MTTAPRLSILAFALLIITLIGGAVLLLTTRPEPVHIVIEPPVPTPTATTLISLPTRPCSTMARKTRRPIRPKPLIATLTGILVP